MFPGYQESQTAPAVPSKPKRARIRKRKKTSARTEPARGVNVHVNVVHTAGGTSSGDGSNQADKALKVMRGY